MSDAWNILRAELQFVAAIPGLWLSGEKPQSVSMAEDFNFRIIDVTDSHDKHLFIEEASVQMDVIISDSAACWLSSLIWDQKWQTWPPNSHWPKWNHDNQKRSEEKEETKTLRVCGEIFIRQKRSSKLKDRTTRERGDDTLTPDLQMTDTVAVATQ